MSEGQKREGEENEKIKIRTRRIVLTHSPSGKLERKIQTSEIWIEDIMTKIREGGIEVLRPSKATVTFSKQVNLGLCLFNTHLIIY